VGRALTAPRVSLAPALVERLHRQAGAQRWRVSLARFEEALSSSAAKAFETGAASDRDLAKYLSTLHLADLALACACAEGDAEAWDHFVLEQRPHLYRAADAIAPGGGARDVADSLYGELFGLRERAGERHSLFRYFHGRSSLTTWLRAMLAQRHVDRLRSSQKLEPLPEEESASALAAPPRGVDPDRDRDIGLMRQTIERAVSRLEPRDRLRLACYYAQQMTLSAIGRLLGEHEATASRHLARSRKAIRADVERQLRETHGLADAAVARCFESVLDDAGPLDVGELLGPPKPRKDSAADRSR